MNQKLVHTILNDFEIPKARLGTWVCSNMFFLVCAKEVQPGRAWYSLEQPSTLYLVQRGTAYYSPVQPGTALYSRVQPCTAEYSLLHSQQSPT